MAEKIQKAKQFYYEMAQKMQVNQWFDSDNVYRILKLQYKLSAKKSWLANITLLAVNTIEECALRTSYLTLGSYGCTFAAFWFTYSIFLWLFVFTIWLLFFLLFFKYIPKHSFYVFISYINNSLLKEFNLEKIK